MKILIQDARTGEFLKETGDWTNSVEEALYFRSSQQAVSQHFRSGVTDVRLVFRFNREKYSVTVPLERMNRMKLCRTETRGPSMRSSLLARVLVLRGYTEKRRATNKGCNKRADGL